MDQTSFGAIGSGYWIRFHQMPARACTVAGFVGLLTGCLETARVLTETPSDAKLAIRNSGPQRYFSAESPGPASPGPSSFATERPLSPAASYSEDYWTALAELDLAALRNAARSEPEIGFAEGIALLAAGDQEKAESTFVAMTRQATDVNVAAASQIMLATTLLYERKWTTLRDLSISSGRGLASQQNRSDLERWGKAFASVDPQMTTLPEKPVTLPLRITALGTPAVRVRINGKEYEFWLDTGSSMTVLSSNVASDAGVPILSPDTLSIRTWVGAAPVRPGAVKRMNIGPIVFTNIPAIVMDASLMRLRANADGVRGGGLRVDGIIGWDIIRQLDVVMDYQSATITFRRPERLGTNGTAFQNLVWVGKPLVQVRAKHGGRLRFALDTGAQASFLNASILERVGVATRASEAIVFGVARTGGRTNRVVPVLTLDVGGKSLRLESVIVYGPVSSGMINCDGILGSDIARFGKIRIDATNGLFSVGE
jgi:predicted aspartyl protease